MRAPIGIVTLIVSVTFLGTGVSASAESPATGQVVLYHLNSTVPDRGPCIQMNPALPQTPWACLYKSNALYKELNAMLLLASASGKSCWLLLDQKDSGGFWQIAVASCMQ